MNKNILRYYFEYCLFKPIYWQLSFIFLAMLGIIGLHDFYYVQTIRHQIKQWDRKNKTLEKQLQIAKNHQKSFQIKLVKPDIYLGVSHYLKTPSFYFQTNQLLLHLTSMTVREGLYVRQLKLEKRNALHRHSKLLMQMSVSGNYHAFIRFCLALNKAPYLTQIKTFKLEKGVQTEDLYADIFIHIHLFK